MRAGRSSLIFFFTLLRPTRRLFSVALLTSLLAATTLTVLPRATRAQVPDSDSIPEADSMQIRRFRLADSYLRAGQPEQAIPLLEDLYAARPETSVFYSKLKEAYESVKRYDEAIALIEERLAERRTPAQLSEKARLLYLKGSEQEALATWDQAIAAAPGRQSTYRVVYPALVEVRRFQQAIDVMAQGRERVNSPNAFRVEIAYLYSLTGQHEKAIEEYLTLLSENSRRLAFVRSRLRTFIQQDDALDVSISATRSVTREAPLNLAYRELLAWLYVEAEAYREAFDVYRAIDRLQQGDGSRLLSFARQAADAEEYAVALDAYNEVLTRYPNAAVTPQAQHSLGDMYRRWAEKTGERVFDDQGNRRAAPHYEAAAEAYQVYLQQYPNRDAYPTVLQKLGRLQQDVFMRLDEAEATLREVVRRYPKSEAANEARYDLGRIALLRGDLRAAQLAFSRLVERLRTGDLAERARYELALLHFYRGEFESALARVKNTNTNTSTDVANDAIALKVLLLQNRGPDSLDTPLLHYAGVKLLQRQRRYNQALSTIDTLLARSGRHPLVDEARFLRATILRQQGRAESAVKAFLEVSLMFPKSSLADRSLFQAAQLQEQSLRDTATALDTYTRLLKEYPNSLLADKARARIRALQHDVSS